LRENKEAIDARIERGLAQLDRGEGIPRDKLRARLEADKAACSRSALGREILILSPRTRRMSR
jgi:predicted transcriptional regulator